MSIQGFDGFMRSVLPSSNGGKSGLVPHITSSYDQPRANHPGNIHGAIDFNYIGGQAVNTPNTFTVYCPIGGTVLPPSPGSYGEVFVKDDKGFIHGFLHMTNIQVKVGSRISGGQAIGIMGHTGPGITQVHVHYQIQMPWDKTGAQPRDGYGKLIDPIAFWNGGGQSYTVANLESDINTHPQDPGQSNKEPSGGGTGTISDIVPRQAGIVYASNAQYALWTNRVPQKEPWNRVMMVDTENINAPTNEVDTNVNHNPQFTEDNDYGRMLIGTYDGDIKYTRGPFWRR